MKSKEIKAKIETENRSLMDLIEKEDLEGAKAKKVEIRKLMDDLEKAEKEEKQEEEEIEKRKEAMKKWKREVMKMLLNY